MTYREETVDTLRAKLDDAEREIERLRTDKDGRAEAREKERRTQRWALLRRAVAVVLGGAAIWFAIFAALTCVDSCNATMAADREARREAHRQHLEQMRAHVPEHVDPRLWSWCIDHCERWHAEGVAEGVLVQAFVDYGINGQTTTRVTVRGPWMTSEGADVISVSLTSSGVDASSVLHAGDLVRLHSIGGENNDERVEFIPSPFTDLPPTP